MTGDDGRPDSTRRASDAPAADAAARARMAELVAAVARGSRLGRTLDEAEAREAMAAILTGAADPAQTGAFLAVLRYRRETPAELAGFVRAAHTHGAAPATSPVAMLDWPSYADRHRQMPYFLLAALLLAEAGVGVLMHGIAGTGPATTPAVLASLGLGPAGSLAEAAAAVAARGFAYLPLAAFCPRLERVFELRALLGVRTAVNSFARALNPGNAPCQLQGVFHPNYLAPQREAAARLGQPHLALFKGGAGEVQRNPEKPCRVLTLHDGVAGEEEWPALTQEAHHPWREEPLDPARVVDLWRGAAEAPGPVAAIVGTAAIALKLTGRATTIEAAENEARRLWRARPRTRFGA